MTQQITTKLILKRDDKILLIRRNGGNDRIQGKFELPGGKIEYGEAPLMALKREVMEELGAQLETTQLLKAISFINQELSKQYIVLVYMGSLVPGQDKVTLSQDHDRYEWVRMQEIQQELITDMTKDILADEIGIQKTDTNESPVEKNTTAMHTHESVIIYADGGSRGNPGPSASGFVIMTTEEEIIFEGGVYLGITTNNQAEYHAVRLGLEKARELGVRKIQFRLDSLLVVNQMTGIYKIKNRDLWPIHANIKELIKDFESVTFNHVRREFNKLADGMVNQVLDKQAGRIA